MTTPAKRYMDGSKAMLVAHLLTRAGTCRRNSIGWRWYGRWASQDWKDLARHYVELARNIRVSA